MGLGSQFQFHLRSRPLYAAHVQKKADVAKHREGAQPRRLTP